MTDYLKSLLQRADIGQSRSAITNPLQWIIVILISGISILWKVGTPVWLLEILSIFLGIFMLLFLVAYIYFGLKNPDALRSEHYVISKLLIERGLTGDNLSGLIDQKDSPSTDLVVTGEVFKDAGR